MCSPIPCRKCGKFTYVGCGEHLDHAFAGIPEDMICTGREVSS